MMSKIVLELTWQAFFDAEDVEKAIEVMNILESKGELDMCAYTAMIKGFCKLNRIDDANQLLYRTRVRGYSPNIVTYNKMISSLCRRGKLDLALKLVDKLLKGNCKPNVFTYTILIEATMLEGGINEAMKLFNEMFKRRLKLDVYLYSTMIRGFCIEGLAQEALTFSRSLTSKGFHPDIMSYNIALRPVGRMVDEATQLFKGMEKVYRIKATIISYDMVLLCLRKECRMSDAVEL
ncbi:hypothetical protein Cgig2_000030 [Carnegiea gigantea]|uniref:Pentatricopeptide repeat-containing protein n=1 Tax=Carnegiea gigantea TaxID=171969 RepID=A0A9Q1KX35_9CARY|nr:hypothetical protein Cgig2_000030 [Carnegiea gigantea]